MSTPDTNTTTDDDGALSLTDQLWEWVFEEFSYGIDIPDSHNAFGHLDVGRRSFFPGDRSSGMAELGDATGVVELSAQFDGSPPSGLRWALKLPYGRGEVTLEADAADLTLDLYAGAAGLFEVRLESVDSSGDVDTEGRAFVSVPWFAIVEVGSYFTDTFSNSWVGDPERLLRRSRTIADYLLSIANVRTIWPEQPFADTVPAQFGPEVENPTTGSFLATGKPALQTKLEGCATDEPIRVELDGMPRLQSRRTTTTGADLFVEYQPPIDQTSVDIVLASAHDRITLEEELTARYLGIQIAQHVFRGMGVKWASGQYDRSTGELMVPDLHLADPLSTVERHVFGIIVNSGADFPQADSYIDRVEKERSRLGIPSNLDQYGLPKGPYTALDVLASPGPAARSEIEKLAPLTAPVPMPEGPLGLGIISETEKGATLRDPAQGFTTIPKLGEGASDEQTEQYAAFKSRPQVGLIKDEFDDEFLGLDPGIRVLVADTLEHETHGTLVFVMTLDEREIGWIAANVVRSADEPSEDEVCFPSGDCLQVVDGPDEENEQYWQLSEEYWDPHDSGVPLLDTSGANREKRITDTITVGDYAYSGGNHFDKARIDPTFARFLQAFHDEVNERLDDDVVIQIYSGYRSHGYNLSDAYHWPSDLENIERIEEGEWEVDGKTYDFKLTMADQAEPIYKDLTQSEHSSGRGADLFVVSTTTFTVHDDDAYLRMPPNFETAESPNPPTGYEFWQRATEIRFDQRDGNDGYWELVDGSTVRVVDRKEEEGVVQVENIDGKTLGWTKASNLTPVKNPGVTLVELGKIALETPIERTIKCVSPCDTRIGIEADDNYIHVDIKPRYLPGGGYIWDYNTDAAGEKALETKRKEIDQNHGCGGTPTYQPNAIYTVTDSDAWLRIPPNFAEVKQPDPPTEYKLWKSAEEITYDLGEEDVENDEVWEIKQGTTVRVVDQAENGTVVKMTREDGTELGWTNLSNLRRGC